MLCCSSEVVVPVTALFCPWHDSGEWLRVTQLLSARRSNTPSLLNETLQMMKALLPVVPKRRKYESFVPSQFRGLHTVIADMSNEGRDEFLCRIIPWMQQMVLKCPRTFSDNALPLLLQGKQLRLTFSAEEVCALLSCAFFSLFPWRHAVNTYEPDAAQHEARQTYAAQTAFVNMSALFDATDDVGLAKIQCILQYFVASFSALRSDDPPLNIEITRCVLESPPNVAESDAALAAAHFMSDGGIDDWNEMAQVLFCSSALGGDVLCGGRGSRQEVVFATRPELLASRLFCETLLDNEAVIVSGAVAFSAAVGYKATFRCTGTCEIPPPTRSEVEMCVRESCIVLMDAAVFSPNSRQAQYRPESIERAMSKALCAFKGSWLASLRSAYAGPVATGNWGCGLTCGGDPYVAFLVQLCAASITKRPLEYFTPGDRVLAAQLNVLHQRLCAVQWTAGNVYRLLLTLGRERPERVSVLDFALMALE